MDTGNSVVEVGAGAGGQRGKLGDIHNNVNNNIVYIYEGDPLKWNLFIKMCIYSYMFKLQSPSKHSPLDAIHLPRCFPLLKTVFELSDFDAF